MLLLLHRNVPATVASVQLQDSFSSMKIDTTHSFNHNAKDTFGSLLSETHTRLLEVPSLPLVVSHSGTPFDYAEQCSASKGIVSVDQNR
jgi:hypothetical protein